MYSKIILNSNKNLYYYRLQVRIHVILEVHSYMIVRELYYSITF